VLHIHHINLQPLVGGGEVYTRFFTRALADAGARVTLHVDPANRLWDDLATPSVRLAPARNSQELIAALPPRDALILTQSAIPGDLLDAAVERHALTGVAHMPMHGRSPGDLLRYRLVLTVSRYCIELLRRAGVARVYAEPLYGTYLLERPDTRAIVASSPYLWDARKWRDRFFGVLAPAADALRSHRVFHRAPGLTLGIVSLISPIKQFPLLFSHLAPILARYPQLRLEIFGNGGYSQVRDLRRAVAPLAGRVRFWGHQPSVQAIYPQLDYLMTGLPEKEALGLNVLEAEACGTPVLAPDAPPFTETVVHGETGYLYRDPREDHGADFAALLARIVSGKPRPDPRAAAAHLAQFSYAALVERAQRLLEHLTQAFPDAGRQ
jgi:glycosyltransferase involved in cell wall biosynthesis